MPFRHSPPTEELLLKLTTIVTRALHNQRKYRFRLDSVSEFDKIKKKDVIGEL